MHIGMGVESASRIDITRRAAITSELKRNFHGEDPEVATSCLY